MMSICIILIGTTLVIIAWQEEWGTFSTAPSSSGPTTTKLPSTTRSSTRPAPNSTQCAQGMNPVTSQKIPCCNPVQSCTWQTAESAIADGVPMFPDTPGTPNSTIDAETCKAWHDDGQGGWFPGGYFDGCWKDNSFYPTNYPDGNLITFG